MIIIAFLAVAFLTGAITGVLVLIVLSVSREDHRGHLPSQAPTRITAAARVLTGLRVSGPENAPVHAALGSHQHPHRAPRTASGGARPGCPLAHRHPTAPGIPVTRCGSPAARTAPPQEQRPA
jgi:hypothetical protein